MLRPRPLMGLALFLPALALAASGCATYQAQAETMTKAWGSGQLAVSAKQFRERAIKEVDSADAVLWHLEAATAQRAIGEYGESNRLFDTAIAKIDEYERQAKVKVGREALATMSNQQNLPYDGRSYDKIMAHTYKALNYLALGEIDKARPEIIRAYQRQQDAVAENQRRIEAAQEEERKSKHQAQLTRARADAKFSQALDGAVADFKDFRFYADYVNPFTVYLDGLYFMHAGGDASDLERARTSLKRVQEVTGDNKFVQADLAIAETGNGAAPAPFTYVIFETGQAASRDQVRIDIPIIVTRVSYVGAAFPKLKFHGNYATDLTVSAGGVEETTVPVASMDSIIALDFKNEWPTIITKTTISVVAKGVAAYVINDAVDRQSEIAGLIARIATAIAQAAVNIADTRTWTTLPKEFQIARVPTPPDRKIVLSTPGSAPTEVVVEEGTVNVIYAKSIAAGDRLIVSQFKLR